LIVRIKSFRLYPGSCNRSIDGSVARRRHRRAIEIGASTSFVPQLARRDREAAKQALSNFLSGKPLSANQIKFIDMIVNHLVENGFMDPGLLYESPFTDINPTRGGVH